MQYVLIALVVLIALALVAVPFVRSPRGGHAGAGDLDPPTRPAPPATEPHASGGAPAAPYLVRAGVGSAARADTPLEQEILRYREALRAGTICEHCSSANPPGSRFCKECGEQF